MAITHKKTASLDFIGLWWPTLDATRLAVFCQKIRLWQGDKALVHRLIAPVQNAPRRTACEQKRAEEALQKTQMELAHVARVTTLGALTASIAHEVSQPLAGLLTSRSPRFRTGVGLGAIAACFRNLLFDN
jgi:hypothetical protein